MPIWIQVSQVSLDFFSLGRVLVMLLVRLANLSTWMESLHLSNVLLLPRYV
ncbi:hypothetical protein Golax_002512 [Gossypium laxum]|uniref:Uncharacterized protein n=2 Tax=Gossypium TaxID=3633 RepID=A0A7J9AS01_9ROSI|nr:hypothetical protein [Gossypium laxum]